MDPDETLPPEAPTTIPAPPIWPVLSGPLPLDSESDLVFTLDAEALDEE